MAGGTVQENQQVNWQDKYIDKLSQDMNSIRTDMQELRGMEARMAARFDAINERMEAKFDAINERMEAKFDTTNSRIDALSNHMQSIVVALVIGIGAIIVSSWLK